VPPRPRRGVLPLGGAIVGCDGLLLADAAQRRSRPSDGRGAARALRFCLLPL
jgi:hypothetical protein